MEVKDSHISFSSDYKGLKSLHGRDSMRANKLLDVALQSWKLGQYTDITISVGGQTFKAHRIILTSLSDFFHPLMQLDDKGTGVVKLGNNIEPADFAVLLEFAYTGQVEITTENVQNLLVSADYLQVDYVKHECIKFMQRYLDLDNIFDVLTLASNHSLVELKACAVEFFKRNLDKISKCKQFVAEFFYSDDLVLYENNLNLISTERECLILTAVLRYLSGQPKENITIIDRLIKSVRLAQLPMSQINNCLDKCKSLRKHKVIKKYVKLREGIKQGEPVKSGSDIPEAWTRPRKLACSEIFVGNRRYADGGEVAACPEPPSFLYQDPNIRLRKIEIWTRRWSSSIVIAGLTLTYDNPLLPGTVHVSTFGSEERAIKRYQIELEPDEFIIKSVIRSGWLIDSLSFTTNKRKNLGPFGGNGGNEYSESAASGTLSYLYDICCDTVITEGSKAIYNLMFRWIKFM
ncbi:ectoderm-neural cortex protein 1-like [Physella acuta]|uniref:ectoderm-neural cortex protein 1-like n=1 Tax=Physella acuta TaxID=109671 RepID=UPI0027DC98A1|nr:ectoderm-neural cortex protein 1-like [Physella acuta]